MPLLGHERLLRQVISHIGQRKAPKEILFHGIPEGTRFGKTCSACGAKRAAKCTDHGDHARVTCKKFCPSGDGPQGADHGAQG
jgi:hypothetical protein